MRLKFFSFTKMIQNTKSTVMRFPLASLIALLGTIVAIFLLHSKCTPPSYYAEIFLKLLLTLSLGFPLAVAVVLFGEQQQWQQKYRVMANRAEMLFLIVYYLLLPKNIFVIEEFFQMRYFVWMSSFIISLTFISFLQKEKVKMLAFWQYNRIMLLSLAVTIFYGLFIQIGLSIAIGSVDFLFNVEIDSKRYMELWIIVVGIFSTMFFLSRIPKNTLGLPEEDFYPRELRMFSQYVLVPLVAVYFLILYAYVAKVLITWDWPKGMLAYMILGFSFLGVLTYVSLYPLREKVGWIKKAGQIFYFILIPQIVMLFWTLWFRISQYGITEKRYLVFVFGLWLLGIGIYFLLSRKKDIRIIPITIFIIALSCSFGPWGAFAVSRRNQTGRLKEVLIKNNLLISEKIKKSEKKVPFDDRKEISAIIRYLIEVHGVDVIQPLFRRNLTLLKDQEDIKSGRKGYSSVVLPSKIVEELLGFTYVNRWENRKVNDEYFSLNTSQIPKQVLDVSKYNYMAMLSSHSKNNNIAGDIGEIDGVKYRFEVGSSSSEFVIFQNNEILIKISLQEFLNNILVKYSEEGKNKFLREELKVEHKDENINFALCFSHISGKRGKDNKYLISYINATFLFSL